MLYSTQWATIGLPENSFAVSPPSNPDSAMWVDRTSLKADFENVLREAKGSALSQVILCRGPIGGGKTHASLYFQLKERWPQQDPSVRDVSILRIPTPKETDKPERDFYLDVMEHISLETICAVVQQSVAEIGYEQSKHILKQIMVSADLTQALLDLGKEEHNPLLKAYFLDKCTSSELRKLGLNRNIEKTQDYFRVLAGIFQCLIGLSASHTLSVHNRVCLWLDEMEDFVYFSPAQYRPFGQGLRELVDRIPNFFSLFLNFTLTAPEEDEEIELILGNYLIDRVTKQIFFQEMTDEEMFSYVAEMVAYYRTQQGTQPAEQPFFPFEEQALKLLLAHLPHRTPRDINKRCRNALIRAFESGLFDGTPPSLIDSDFVQRITRDELYKEVG